MRKIQLGSISTGTLRTEDLLPAVIGEIEYLITTPPPSHIGTASQRIETYRTLRKACNDAKAITDYDSEDASYMVDELIDALNEYAPPHMRFGAHEGDGADFGWWPTDFDDCERVAEQSGKNGECEFVDIDCNIYVEVNDHGNMAVYKTDTVADGTGYYRIHKGALIWDCV